MKPPSFSDRRAQLDPYAPIFTPLNPNALSSPSQNLNTPSSPGNQNFITNLTTNGIKRRSNNFSVGHLNINRLLHKTHFVKDIIQEHNLSILALSETWLNEDISDNEIAIPNYRLVRRDRSGRLGGGVCIFIHCSLNYRLCHKIQNPSLEMIWIQINLRKEQLYIGCLYRPPSEPVHYWSVLDECLEDLEGKSLILMGDLNVDILNSSDPCFHHLKTVCDSLALKNIIDSPTRITATSSKCLDVILSNVESFTTGKAQHYDFSDHALVYFKTEKMETPQQHVTKVTTRRSWPTNPIREFRHAVENTLSSLTATSAEFMWKEWHEKFMNALDATAPIVHKPCRQKRPRCPWMTPDLLQTLHKQKTMYRRVVRSQRQDLKAVSEHRRLRNQFQTMYRQLKNNYFQSRLQEYRKSPMLFWKTLNIAMGRKPHRLQPSASVSDLALHFQSLLTTPSGSAGESLIPFGPYAPDHLLDFSRVTAKNIHQLLSKLVYNKAAGPDGIGTTELKFAAPVIASSLSTLFNASLSTGKVPTDFKNATICPILKPGKQNSSSPENYRGISLLPTVSKVLERVVHDEVSTFLSNRGALSNYQFGFRTNHSCADLLLLLMDDLLIARDEKKFTVAVFIDLSKAFDNVRHQDLLLLLQKNGIGGTALDWFHNYLTNRKQKVISGQNSSASFVSNKGVPQGSVLGPLLFNLYVADLPSTAEKLGTKLPSFADDMTLYSSSSSLSAACDAVTRSLTVLVDTLTLRGLTVNMNKTSAMIFAPPGQENIVNASTITVHGKTIRITHSTRLLGVIVDDKLSWAAQVQHLQKTIGRKIGLLKRSSRQLTPAAKRQFFLSVIQPDFEYAAASTIPFMPVTLRNHVVSLWHRAVRSAAGASREEDFTSVLEKMRLTAIEKRWTMNIMLLVRRCALGTAPPLLTRKLNKHTHGHNTRGCQLDFRPLRPSSLSGRLSFSNRAPLLWNLLPTEVQSSQSLYVFKNHILSLLSCRTGHNLLQLSLGNTTTCT